MKNLSIRTKLFTGFGSVLLIFIAISVLSYIETERNKKAIDTLKNEVIRDTFNFLELQKDVIQIQQFLTDVSATKDTSGYQDAEAYYTKAKKTIEDIIKYHSSAADKSMHQTLLKISGDLDSYYNLGKHMADTYINRGADEGNKIMDTLDPYSETINTKIESFVSRNKSELVDYFEQLNHNFDTINFIRIAATLISLLLVIFIAILIAASIVRPVKTVAEKADAMGKGDISKNIDFFSKDEIGRMTEALNSFILSLRKVVGRIQDVSAATLEIRQDLVSTTEETASTSNEIAATVTSLKEQMDNLNNEISEVAGAEEQFRVAVESLDDQIANQASATEESTASIEEMIASIRNVSHIVGLKRESAAELVKTAAQRGEAIQKSNENIKSLLKLTDEVSSIAGMIMEIAKQTNILSMNAAIEAAHAGEAGKGFSVVAEEIRKLAETSNENASQITLIIEKVMEGIERTSRESAENVAAFTQINREINSVSDALAEINSNASELAAGGEQILKAMTQLNEITVSVREGGGEMKKGINQISESVQKVSAISSTVVNGVTEIETGTKEISQAMVMVNELSKKIGENSVILDEEVKHFKVS